MVGASLHNADDYTQSHRRALFDLIFWSCWLPGVTLALRCSQVAVPLAAYPLLLTAGRAD
jgi:hypothetical protein